MMNSNLGHYVTSRQTLASDRGLCWNISLDACGQAEKDEAWDLTRIAGSTGDEKIRLNDFGYDKNILVVLNERREREGREAIPRAPVPAEWQDLIKAVAIDRCVNTSNKPGHVRTQVIRPLRVIATAAIGAPPSDLTRQDIELAVALAEQSQPSGHLAGLVDSVARHVIDHYHFANRSPLLPAKPRRASGRSQSPNRSTQERTQKSRRTLSDRKQAHKLPEERAFWELVRILFTEQPRSYIDAIRFAQLKIMLITGLRVTEIATLPFDWKRTKEYRALDGESAGKYGGISQSIALSYFAQKQQARDRDKELLYPNIQYIPTTFEEAVENITAEVEHLTAPLRKTLTEQSATGRILTAYDPDDIVPIVELFPYLSGNPKLCEDSYTNQLIDDYNKTFDTGVLDQIERRQKALLQQGHRLRNEVQVYFSRLRKADPALLPCYLPDGSTSTRLNFKVGGFRVSDVEMYVRKYMDTKVKETRQIETTAGKILRREDFLFLIPRRALISQRNSGVCDIRKYFSVAAPSSADLMIALGIKPEGKYGETIFAKYGRTDDDRKLRLNTHSLRHLQNTELFRLGIADAAITKRFGRRSVAQSYEYDHRSLAEDLDAVDVPSEAADILPEKAQRVFQLLSSNAIAGPVVEEFRRIQEAEGDEAAFQFLAAEADGFHTTPYGFCINSFTVDPCPKHLECFNGCRHLTATSLPEHRESLNQLQTQLETAVQKAEATPSGSAGRNNQIEHARSRLSGVRKVLASAPGDKPFPDGPDLSDPTQNDGPKRTALDD